MINTPVSIVMLSWNQWHLTHARLGEITTRLPRCEVLVVDNASTDRDVHSGIDWWQKHGPRNQNISFIKSETNLGFGGGNNLGAEWASRDILVITQNDVVMHTDWLSDMLIMLGQDQKMIIGGRIIDWNGGWNAIPDGRYVPYAEGWFLALYKSAWEDLGGFDPQFNPCDFEDVDLSTQALYKGYHLVGFNSSKLKHLGGQSIGRANLDREKITQAHRKLWLSKWNGKWDEILTVRGVTCQSG